MKVELHQKYESNADVLIVGVFENEDNALAKEALKSRAPHMSEQFSFESEYGRKALILGIKKHVLLYGLGKKKDLTLNKIRKAASEATTHCKNLGNKTLAVHCFGSEKQYSLRANIEGVMLGSYDFLKYKTIEKKKKSLDSVEFLVDNPALAKAEFTRTVSICETMDHIRNLGNEPSNVMTPTKIAEYAQSVAKTHKLKCTIFDEKEIRRRKMGGLIAVSQGSKESPRFIVLEYEGKKGADKICVVGKGITFDTGGISIKPSERMEEMKFDMCGAAAAIGVIEACARTNVPLNITAVIPTCENMPSGSAYKPGDIVTTMSGKTIEVLNTDAEGRVILSDGLYYASSVVKPKVIFDFATLTGACVVALGSHCCGAMGNSEEFMQRVLRAGKTSGEAVWQLPLWDEYREEVKSDIADIKNLGKPREAGTIAGAAFLEHFVGDTPWVHLDIAGVAWNTAPRAEMHKGATGFGVRLLLEVFRQWNERPDSLG